MENKWEVGPVKLANGWDAVIHNFCEKRQKYIGELRDGSGSWHAREWFDGGRYHSNNIYHDYNLAPPPKKTVRVRAWLVVWTHRELGSVSVFYEQKNAVINAKKHGFALIEIDREVTEGEGL
jgi:hypothetical protein